MFEGFKFHNSEYLFGLIIIPVLILLFLFFMIKKNRDMKKLGRLKIISSLMPEVSYSRPVLKFLLLLATIFFIIIGIARPQFGSQLKEVKTKGAEVIIALDISNSMLAKEKNSKLNRLEKAKNAINNIINNLENDKIGLIVFAGEAYMQVPLTADYAAIKMFLSSVHPGYITAQGTEINLAIDLAISSFSPTYEKDKTIIIISDGENHNAKTEQSIKLAEKQKIIIHTVGIGSTKGNPIPDPYKKKKYLKDKKGDVIISKLNESMLANIAKSGNGIYVNINKNPSSYQKITRKVSQSEKGEITIFAKYDDKYYYFILIALIFFIIEFFILNRRNRWLSKFINK